MRLNTLRAYPRTVSEKGTVPTIAAMVPAPRADHRGGGARKSGQSPTVLG